MKEESAQVAATLDLAVKPVGWVELLRNHNLAAGQDRDDRASPGNRGGMRNVGRNRLLRRLMPDGAIRLAYCALRADPLVALRLWVF